MKIGREYLIEMVLALCLGAVIVVVIATLAIDEFSR